METSHSSWLEVRLRGLGLAARLGNSGVKTSHNGPVTTLCLAGVSLVSRQVGLVGPMSLAHQAVARDLIGAGTDASSSRCALGHAAKINGQPITALQKK